MRIVDDDVSWTSISTTKPEKEEEEDDGDLPVVCIFWGCKDFEIQAFQSQLPVQVRFVRGKVGQRILYLQRSTIFFFKEGPIKLKMAERQDSSISVIDLW